jgi:hypothetical protein
VSSLTYVYCLVLGGRRPSIPAESTGIPGGREMRAIPAGAGLWLIVATVPAKDYDEPALAKGLQNLDWVGRRAMAHEAVIEQFLSARAVLPMQLFTLFTSDERAVQHVARQRKGILAVLKRIEKKVEWGLRLTFDEGAVRTSVEASAGKRAKETPSGAAYLARKRDLLDVTRGRLKAARGEADRLFAALKKEAAESRRRSETEQASAGARLLLDAAFLVPASRTRAFRAAVGRHARTIGANGIVVSLTGPWPPYNFISPSRSASAKHASGQL